MVTVAPLMRSGPIPVFESHTPFLTLANPRDSADAIPPWRASPRMSNEPFSASLRWVA